MIDLINRNDITNARRIPAPIIVIINTVEKFAVFVFSSAIILPLFKLYAYKVSISLLTIFLMVVKSPFINIRASSILFSLISVMNFDTVSLYITASLINTENISFSSALLIVFSYTAASSSILVNSILISFTCAFILSGFS